MPPGDPTPDTFAPPDAGPGALPDWLSGSAPDAATDSSLLLSRALALPDFPAELLGVLGREANGAEPAPAPQPPTADAPASGAATDADGWSVTRSLVRPDPAGPADAVHFRLQVTNRAPALSYECRCRLPLPAGVTGVRASHAPRRTAGGLSWELGTLAPGDSKTVHVRLPLTALTARFRTEPAVAFVSTRPDQTVALGVTCDHPAVVAAGAGVPLRVAVENRGAGASGRLRVEVFHPGRTTPVARVEADPLPGRGARTVELLLPAAPVGPTACRVVVTASGHPPVHATTEYATAAPDLALELAAPEVVETDDEITCRVSLANRGALPARGVRASFAVPDELLFREASNGGALALDGTGVEWAAFDLPPGGCWEADVRVAGFAPGRLSLRAVASVPGAPDATAGAPLVCAVRRTAGGASLAELLAGLAAPVPDNEDAEPTAATEVGERHLMFRAAGGRFAAPLGAVREVLRPQPITPVPGTPGWLAGVANVRGDIVPVVVLAQFLELDAPDAPRGLVILGPEGGERLGLLVDDVLGIRPLAPTAEAVPGDHTLARFLTGVTTDAAGVIHRLDTNQLLAATDVAAATA